MTTLIWFSDESDLEVVDEEFGEETKVSVLPIPSDLPKEERALMERAVQELMREASAFIKGRSAKKKINQGLYRRQAIFSLKISRKKVKSACALYSPVYIEKTLLTAVRPRM